MTYRCPYCASLLHRAAGCPRVHAALERVRREQGEELAARLRKQRRCRYRQRAVRMIHAGALALLAAFLPAQTYTHPPGVRTVANSAPCYGNWASVPSSPHVGATGGVWLTMDRAPYPGRPLGWRVENDFFFLTRGSWLIAIDFGRSFAFRMPSPASECWLTVPLRYTYWPTGIHGMGTTWVLSPWRIPWSAPPGWSFLCTAIGWSWEASPGRFSHVWASQTVAVQVQ